MIGHENIITTSKYIGQLTEEQIDEQTERSEYQPRKKLETAENEH